jgi:hypothetical protein
MAARRAFLAGIAIAASGCVGPGNSNQETGQNEENGVAETPSDATESDTDDESSYHLRAAPVEAGDREPVLSSADEAVAEIKPLIDLLETVAETFEVKYTSLSPSDAEAFEALIDGVERYPAGNPPGYYIDHQGLVVSISRSG